MGAFLKQTPYVLNRLQGFDCSSWAATGTEVNIEAFFQHTVIVSDFPLIVQEPTARVTQEQQKISYSSCFLAVRGYLYLVFAREIRNKTKSVCSC